MAKPVTIGPRMAEVVSYVADHPGCTKQEASLSLDYRGMRSNAHGYAAVQRAIAAGLIVAIWRGAGRSNAYALYLPSEVPQ